MLNQVWSFLSMGVVTEAMYYLSLALLLTFFHYIVLFIRTYDERNRKYSVIAGTIGMTLSLALVVIQAPM